MDAHTWLFNNLTGAGGIGSLVASWLLILAGLVTLLMFLFPALGLSRAIDTMNTWIGRNAAWLILLAVLVSTANAIVRKVFNTSSNAWLEIQWILFGAVFLLCAPWTLLANEHIRIDIVNSLLSKRLRNWIDVIGHWFFIVPICLVLLYTGIPFFVRSWGQNEQSTNAGGLPVYPAKFLIPLAFMLLIAQGISELIKRRAIMKGMLEDTTSGGGHHAAAEAEAERLVKALAEEAEALAASKAAAAAALAAKS
jgi:TRAP-type mannitol/chloroaromatic compound transport system permease small subunit